MYNSLISEEVTFLPLTPTFLVQEEMHQSSTHLKLQKQQNKNVLFIKSSNCWKNTSRDVLHSYP